MQISFKDLNISLLNLLQPLSLDKVYEVIVEEGMRVSNSIRGILFVRKKRGFEKAYSSPFRDEYSAPRRNGFTFKVFTTGKPLILKKKEIVTIHPESAKRPGSTFIFIPLTYRSETQGVLLLVTDLSSGKASNLLEPLLVFGSMASMAIKKASYEKNLKAAIGLRDSFISVANHELKTPLTTSKSYAELIKRSVIKRKIPPLDWVNNLLFEIKRQNDIINDFLVADQVRLSGFSPNLSSCNLEDLLVSTINTYQSRFKNRTISLVNKSPKTNDYIIADSTLLMQAFSNLINNAAKFSGPETPIRITLQDMGNTYSIKFKDKGDGIREEDLPYIFNYQYKGKNSVVGGMGIGLFITKKIIEVHHGHVNVKTGPKGTEFDITLPKV